MRLGRVILISAAVASSMLLATPAHAASPTRTVFFNVGSYTDTQLCSFPVITSFNERFTDIITYDSAGAPLVDNFHLLGFVQSVNPANGKTLYAKEDVQGRFDFPDLVAGDVAGVNGFIRLPGIGVAVMTVGRLVFDADGNVTFEAGIHSGFPHQQDYCDALADP